MASDNGTSFGGGHPCNNFCNTQKKMQARVKGEKHFGFLDDGAFLDLRFADGGIRALGRRLDRAFDPDLAHPAALHADIVKEEDDYGI